jgi:hypothetical protein
MWFRTALVLILVLLALKFLRELTARLRAPDRAGAVPGSSDRIRGAGTGDAGGAAGKRPSAASPGWPPGEITDVPYRETRTADHD